jgi:hypothetical protein
MFDLPVPWVTKAARSLLNDTEALFTPLGLPQDPPVLVARDASAADHATSELIVSEPTFVFQPPQKTPRKSRAKAKAVAPQPEDATDSEPAGKVADEI